MLYICPDIAGHCAEVPLIAPGVAGAAGETVTVTELDPLVPQLLPAVTEMLPLFPYAPVVTVIDVVPAPAVIVQPVGTVQVYVVAFVTALML